MADLNTKIRGEQIKDGSIAASELATDAVETLKIKDANVTTAKLATDSVETAKIKAKNVTLAKIEDMGLDAHILVANASLRPVSVAVSGDITISNLGVTAIGAGKVGVTELATDAVETVKIKDLNVTTGKLAADAVDATKIADDAIGAEHINAGAEVDGYVLTTDAVGGLTWTAKSTVAEDYIQEAEIQKAVFAGDDSTVAFDVGAAPVANSVQVFLNGMLQEEGSGKDFTLASDIATFATAPLTGDTVQIHSIKT